METEQKNKHSWQLRLLIGIGGLALILTLVAAILPFFGNSSGTRQYSVSRNVSSAADCSIYGAGWSYDTCGDTCERRCKNNVTGEIKPFPGDDGGDIGDLPGIDLTIDDVFNVIYGFACWLWSVSMFIIVIAIIWVGIRMMGSQANATAFTAAKTAFVHVIVGAIVIMGVYVIIATVAYNIGVDISLVPFSCSAPDGDDEEDPVAICKSECEQTAADEAHCNVLSTQEARDLCESGAIYECQQKCDQ